MIYKGINIPPHMKGPMFKSLHECPNIKNHIYGPDGYGDWHEWADKYKNTHEQLKCECGFYCIYKRKK